MPKKRETYKKYLYDPNVKKPATTQYYHLKKLKQIQPVVYETESQVAPNDSQVSIQAATANQLFTIFIQMT